MTNNDHESERHGARDVAAREHLLLTVLGTNTEIARYALGDQQAQAQLAPLALLEVLPQTERPDRVLALCTPQAKCKSWPLLEETLRGRYTVEPVDVPAGDAQADVNSYLAKVAGAIPSAGEVELTVDVTHGYRHG